MSTYTPRHATTFSTPASLTLFRRLTWEGTVPLQISVDSKELPANSDRGLESYFIQAPRVSYLPLLIPELKRFLCDVVFDEQGGMVVKEEDWWFEREDGTLVKWHWPIGLLYDQYITFLSLKPSSSFSSSTATPLRLILHLASPPTDKLLLSPNVEACKQAFMGQLKEADFLRWGNTKRMTGLRKAEQDGIWEGIKEHNFDTYWRIASKITPTTLPTRSHSPTSPGSPPPPSSASAYTRPPSVEPGEGRGDRDGAWNVRSVPVRVYLPDGPVVQELVPPVLEDGTLHTLHRFLSNHLSLLFPPPGSQSHHPPASTRSRPMSQTPSHEKPSLGYATVQGILCPPEAEMAWLGACLAGADGWVNICVGLGKY